MVMILKKKFLLLMLLFLSFLSFKSVVKAEDGFNLKDAASAILIDAKSQTILYEKEIHKRLVPASMTKVMSLILICDAIKSGKITTKTMITASEYAASMGGSQIYLKVGEQFSLDDMLKAICIASANDCVVAVAEALYGSEEVFVDKMNEFSKSLNLENTHFEDSTGLTKTNHYTSAYDMAMMASYLLNNHGEFILKYTSIKEDYLRKDTDNPFWLVNTNKLVGKVDGVDGLKTGWNDASKYCLTATAKRGNMRLISVLMGYDKPLKRNTDTVSLLNYGFANYQEEVILEKGKVIYHVNDIRYKPEEFDVVINNEVTKIITKGSEKGEVSWEITKYPNYQENMPGTINLYYNDELLGEIEFNTIEPVKKNNFFQLWLKVIGRVI